MDNLNIIKLEEGEWLLTSNYPKAKDIKIYYKGEKVTSPIVGIIVLGELKVENVYYNDNGLEEIFNISRTYYEEKQK